MPFRHGCALTVQHDVGWCTLELPRWHQEISSSQILYEALTCIVCDGMQAQCAMRAGGVMWEVNRGTVLEITACRTGQSEARITRAGMTMRVEQAHCTAQQRLSVT